MLKPGCRQSRCRGVKPSSDDAAFRSALPIDKTHGKRQKVSINAQQHEITRDALSPPVCPPNLGYPSPH